MSTESFAPAAIKNSIGLSFHQNWGHRLCAADYGEKYHLDPLYRFEQNRKVSREYHRLFGAYGMGDPDPRPSIAVNIQPLDFLNGALGGRLVYRPDESVWTPDKPLAEAQSLSDLEKKKDIDWPNHPHFQDLFRQIEIMQRAWPHLPIAGVQGVWQDGEQGQHSFLVMHTPYTTAFRLVGEEILVTMMLDPDLAQAIFDWIMRQYENLWKAICQRLGWHGTKIHFGDCAATMLSPDLYEKFSQPLYQRLMSGYEAGVIHSCGRSTHLLESFARVPRINQLQLGDGTDLRRARALFPHSSIAAYYDPGQLRTECPDDIEKKLWRMSEELQDNFSISADGVDPDTPQESVIRFLETAKKISASLAATTRPMTPLH